jgi:hypothetical protein
LENWLPRGREEEGAAGELAGKRKRGNELARQPVRHSLWEQGSLEAYASGCLAASKGRWKHCNGRRLCMMRQGGSLMGVTPVGAAQTVTQAVWQSSR